MQGYGVKFYPARASPCAARTSGRSPAVYQIVEGKFEIVYPKVSAHVLARQVIATADSRAASLLPRPRRPGRAR